MFERIMRICTANTCFATKTTQTKVERAVKFTYMRKVIYIFKEAAAIYKDLKKTFANLGEAKAIASEEKLLYKMKKKEQLKAECHYGFWNTNGGTTSFNLEQCFYNKDT